MTHEHTTTPNKNVENSASLSKQRAEELLAYVDVPSTDFTAALEYVQTNESALAYTDELIDLADKVGQDKLIELSDRIRNDYSDIMHRLGIQSSAYGESVSWSMWDIAKQSYLAKHPEKSSSEYKLSDPFNPFRQEEKIREISSRHIGWELATQYAQDSSVLDRIPEAARASAKAILENGEYNESGQLRSFELAKLGDIIRESLPAVQESAATETTSITPRPVKTETPAASPETPRQPEHSKRLKIAVGEKVWIKTPYYAENGSRDRSKPAEWGDQWEIIDIIPTKGKPEYVTVRRNNETKKVHRAALELFYDLHHTETSQKHEKTVHKKTKEAVLVRPVHFPNNPKLDEWFMSIMSNPDLTPEEREHALQLGPPGNEPKWAREKKPEKLHTSKVRDRLIAEGLDPDTILSTAPVTNHDNLYESDPYLYSDDTWNETSRPKDYYKSDMDKALEALGLTEKSQGIDSNSRHKRLGAKITGAARVMDAIDKARLFASSEWVEIKKEVSQDKKKLLSKLDKNKTTKRVRSLGGRALHKITKNFYSENQRRKNKHNTRRSRETSSR